MPDHLLAVHGVLGLVCAVGEKGRITMFKGDLYHPVEAEIVTTHDLRAVFVESPWSAWACGDAGTVLRWDGARWWPQATGTRLDALNAIWGHPADGLWFGGRRHMFNRHPTYGSSLYDADAEIRAIWGRGPDDLWFLCAGRLALHWNGEGAERHELPGDDDEEWTAVAGTPEGDTFIVGLSGFMLWTNGQRWEEIATDTTDLITGAVCTAGLLYVVTEGGQVREWNGRRWRTVAFSAFGPIHGLCVVDGVLWACGARGVVIQHRPDERGEP